MVTLSGTTGLIFRIYFMRYIMLLWPHANARYQSETLKLAKAELELTLSRWAPGAAVGDAVDVIGMPALSLCCDEPLSGGALEAVRGQSLLYGLFCENPDGALIPAAGRQPARVGDDLPAILKYKGKTNEMFLRLLLNAAVYAGGFWERAGEPLELLDPMCGRATSLFVAANMGWNATGADVDSADLKEAERYFKRYLEYHRIKHSVSRSSLTLRGGRSAPVCRFEYGGVDARSLRLVGLDAALSDQAFPKRAFHVVACDLPYGIRHDAQVSRELRGGGNWLEALLAKALPAWREVLRPGGTVAVSFNAQTLPLARVRALMARTGLEPMQDGPWDGFSHWVEQAITRDIAVARKA